MAGVNRIYAMGPRMCLSSDGGWGGRLLCCRLRFYMIDRVLRILIGMTI